MYLLLLLLRWLLLLHQFVVCIRTATAKAAKQPTAAAFLLWLLLRQLRRLRLRWRRLGSLYCIVLRPLLQVRCLLVAVLLLQPQVGVLKPQEVQGMCPCPPRSLLGTAALLKATQEGLTEHDFCRVGAGERDVTGCWHHKRLCSRATGWHTAVVRSQDCISGLPGLILWVGSNSTYCGCCPVHVWLLLSSF
jgi:hypothetical protein